MQVKRLILQLLKFSFQTKQILKLFKRINAHHCILQVKMDMLQLLKYSSPTKLILKPNK
uniref:Uncharacterized protein n=1 Tax=Arcella intermedia TaxID=1963864 RepID=A0A6B2LWK6_9EUKA